MPPMQCASQVKNVCPSIKPDSEVDSQRQLTQALLTNLEFRGALMDPVKVNTPNSEAESSQRKPYKQ